MKLAFRLPFEANRQSGLSTPLRLLLATTAAFWMGTAQPQVTSGTKVSRQVTELRFRDLFSLSLGPQGLGLSANLLEADGQTVRLVGHMVPQDQPRPGRFLVAPCGPSPSGCNAPPPPSVLVMLDPSQADWQVPHVSGLVAVRGELRMGGTQEVRGQAAAVVLQLGPQANPSVSAGELTGYLHTLRRLS